jgi:hypothetical protein
MGAFARVGILFTIHSTNLLLTVSHHLTRGTLEQILKQIQQCGRHLWFCISSQICNCCAHAADKC